MLKVAMDSAHEDLRDKFTYMCSMESSIPGQGQYKGLRWIVLMQVYLHVKYERFIINSIPKLTAKPNYWDRQPDGHYHLADWTLFRKLTKLWKTFELSKMEIYDC